MSWRVAILPFVEAEDLYVHNCWALAASLILLAGCSGEGKESDPKPNGDAPAITNPAKNAAASDVKNNEKEAVTQTKEPVSTKTREQPRTERSNLTEQQFFNGSTMRLRMSMIRNWKGYSKRYVAPLSMAM